MTDVRQVLRDLAAKAKDLHRQERSINLESVLVIGKLDRMNAAVNLGMASHTFAKFIGLSPEQYWKRAQAARVMHAFPKAQAMVEAGETEVSHLAALAPKITQANSDLLLDGIKGKTKREVIGLVSRVTPDGRLLDREEEFDVTIRLTKSQMATLERAREVLAVGGHAPTNAEAFMKALSDLLDKRDPLRCAERAAKRKQATVKPSAIAIIPADMVPAVNNVVVGPAPAPPSPAKERRAAIPAAVRHAVMLRDGGQCTAVLANNSRCPERAMIELDHIIPVCRGGLSTVENLTCRCRRHNQMRARELLGDGYMVTWADSRSRGQYHVACQR